MPRRATTTTPTTKRRYTPYAKLVQRVMSTPSPFQVQMDTDDGVDPEVNQLFVSTNGHWFDGCFNAGSQLRIALVFRVAGRGDIAPMRISRVNIPSSVRVEGLPINSVVHVHAELEDVVDVSTGAVKMYFPPSETIGRIVHVFKTASVGQRALAYLTRGEISKFVSQVSTNLFTASVYTGRSEVDWTQLRHAAIMLSMPPEWRMFHLRYECSGLMPNSSGSVEYNALVKNTLGVINESTMAASEVFNLPIDHNSTVTLAPRTMIMLTANASQDALVRVFTEDLNAVLQSRSPVTLSVSIRSNVTSHTVGDGVTSDTLLRFCLRVLERHFVLIDGEWWFFNNTTTSRALDELRAMAVAIVSLMQMTGAGPARFALPVVCAFTGTCPPIPVNSNYLPESVQSYMTTIMECTAEELEELDLPSCVSGDGWKVDCGKRLRANNRDELMRRVQEHFWTNVVKNTTLRLTVHVAFSVLYGKYTINGITLNELQGLIAGPETRLDTWREYTGVMNTTTTIKHDDVIDALFSVLADLDPEDVTRVARFWTGEPRSPRRENGQLYGCWVQLVHNEHHLLPVAHTCTKTLEISSRLIRDGPHHLKTALMKSIANTMCDGDEMIYSGD